MKAIGGLTLLAIVGLSSLALLPVLGADEPDKPPEPKPVDVGSLPEVQDVIFYTDKRPVLMRIRLFTDGKPASERWLAFQKKLFAYLDTDGDGFLDKEEAKRVFSPQSLLQLFAGAQNFNGVINAPDFDAIDTDKDGKISPAELTAYYLHSAAGPYAVASGTGRSTTANQLTNALFAALDSNKDGKLSKEEMLTADKVLMKFDDNDDELLTPQELLAVAANPYAPNRQPGQDNGGVTSILLVPKEDPGKRTIVERLKLAKEVMARFDTDKNGKLSQREIGFPKEVFDLLDTNKDGELDQYELLRWVVAKPDVECTMHLGQVDDKEKFIEAANDGKGRGGLMLNATSQTTLVLALESSEVSVQRGSLPRNGGGNRQVQNLRQLFMQIDKEKKGYITLKQVQNPQYAPLQAIFKVAAHDDNDRLTMKDLDVFMEMLASASSAQLVITFTDNGQGLFEMLDSNGDGQLSIREMRNAWNRLAPHAKDATISKNDIPRQYTLIVGGSQVPNGRQVVDAANPGRMDTLPRGPGAQRGPLWFRKMDINGDGDVSEREFLGSKEDFQRINTNGDGLISVEEAIKADAWFREKLQQKK